MNRATVILDGDVGPLRQVLRQAKQDINNFGRESAGALSDVVGPAQALQSRLSGIATAITSSAFAVFVKNSINVQDEMGKMAQKAGVSTEAFSANAYAARLADVDVQTLGKSYAKLSGLLQDAAAGNKDAAETFARLRLDPSNFKDADELLLALAERFERMPDGVDKTNLAIDVFGERVGPGLIPYLNQGREGIVGLREEAERLGIVVTTKAGKAAEEFNDSLTRMLGRVEGVGQRIAQALLPTLTALTSQVLNTRESFDLADTAAAGIKTTLQTLAVVGANVAFVFKGVGRELGAWGAQIALAMEVLRAPPGELIATAKRNWGQWQAISDAVRADGEKALAELNDFEARVMEKGAFAPGLRAQEDRGFRPGSEPFTPGRKAPKVPDAKRAAQDDGERGYLATYEAMLAEEKRVAAVLEQGREYGKDREVAYWRFLLDNATVSSQDRIAMLRKVWGLETEIAQKALRDRQGLEAEYAAQAEGMAMGKLESERAAAQLAFDLGQITRGQLLSLEQQHEARRYEIQRGALQQRLELLAQDPTTSPVERERINTRLLELERQHQAKRAEIAGNMAKDKGGFNFLGDLEGQLGNAFGNMLGSATMFAERLGGLFQSIGNTIINELAVKPAAAWLVAQARMLAAKLGFAAQEKAIDAASSAVKVATKTAETGVVASANAVQAGTGAAASQAAIPVVGPGLAIAAMAAVFAAVMAMASGSRKSAAGGYNIPAGLNPMTQLHEEEMVLPKHLANAVRNMAAGPAQQAPEPGPAVELRAMPVGDFVIAMKSDFIRMLELAERRREYRPGGAA